MGTKQLSYRENLRHVDGDYVVAGEVQSTGGSVGDDAAGRSTPSR